MTVISAVVFDMYGTLTPNWPKSFWDEQKRTSAASLDLPEADWIAALDATWHERVSGSYGSSLLDTFREVAGQLGQTPTEAQLAAAVRHRYEAHRRTQQLRPDVLPTLRALRADGLKIALVSDCTHELSDQWETSELAEFFHATVFSCREGTRKPDPKLFLAAAERLSVPPESCLYVGDGGGDEMAGSAAVGMHPVLLVAPDWLENNTPGRPDETWPGLRATSLTEIPRILAELTAD